MVQRKEFGRALDGSPTASRSGHIVDLPPMLDHPMRESPARLLQGRHAGPEALASSTGAFWPIELCGRTSL